MSRHLHIIVATSIAFSSLCKVSFAQGDFPTTTVNPSLFTSPDDRFENRIRSAAPLTNAEEIEARGFEPGLHILSTGKQVIIFEEGAAFPIGAPEEGSVLSLPASKTAIEAAPGVWAEPELVETISHLKQSTFVAVLSGLSKDPGLYGIPAIKSQPNFEMPTSPPCSIQGSALVHTILHDMRTDWILKRLRQLDPSDASELLRNGLEDAVRLRQDYYSLVKESAQRTLAEIENEDNLIATVTQEINEGSAYAEYPYSNLGYGMLLLAGAQLEPKELHSYLLQLAGLAQVQREEVYGISSDPQLLQILLYSTLYNRQCLLTALIGTSPHPAEISEFALANGAVLEEKELTPFDAYNTYPAGITSAESGAGSVVKVYNKISDELFDNIIALLSSR